ncbi:MAG TPA: hypothetical protein VIH18_21935 [Candidatus Binatia bacterium]|jgi:hypothetical protein
MGVGSSWRIKGLIARELSQALAEADAFSPAARPYNVGNIIEV